MNLNLPTGKLIDISLPLDARTFHMRTYSGFKKDIQFDVEVIKDYEDGGYGQIVRGAHMRLHAGTHVDAPSHMLKGAPDLQDVPLRAYFGDAIIADVRHRGGAEERTRAASLFDAARWCAFRRSASLLLKGGVSDWLFLGLFFWRE